MKRLAILLLLCLSTIIPSGEAAAAQSATVAVCAPTYTVVATASIGAGDINFCIYYPAIVATSASTFQVVGVFTAPPTVAPILSTAASTFVQNSGCTEGTPALAVPSTNGVLGTIGSYASIWTMTGEQCDGGAQMTLTIGVVPLQVYSIVLPITVQTENQRRDNYDYLCDAPGTAPNAHSTTGTTCNNLDIGLRTLAPLSIDANIVGECGASVTPCHLTIDNDETEDGSLTIDVADDSTDDGFLSVPPATISNISVNGTFPSELTVHTDFPGDSDSLGFDAWAALLFWLAAVLFFSYLGWLVALAFAVPGFIASAVPSVASLLDGLGLTFEALIILCLLGFMLEVAANRWSWGGYTSGSRRLRFGA